MKKNRIDVLIDKNAIDDDGNGTIMFKGGLVLSDESVQKNGTRYEMKTMDISQYNGKVFGDHDYRTTGLVGKAIGVAKKGTQLVAQGVSFAIETSAFANFVYDMVRNGWLTDVSIGTMGDLEKDDNGAWVYRNSRLLEFSFVGIGNNDNAHINQAAKNAIEHANSEGLDTKEFMEFLQANKLIDPPAEDPEPAGTSKNNNEENQDMKFLTFKNSRDFAIEVAFKNASGEDVKLNLLAGASFDASEDQKEAIEKQINSAEAPKEDLDAKIEAKLNSALSPIQASLEKIEKNAFNNGAQEPGFKPATNGAPVEGEVLDGMDLNTLSFAEITGLQVENFWKASRGQDADARKVLTEINKFNLEKLKEAKLVKNSLTITDFGNFVTNPELITEIQGYRSDFSELLSVFNYRETNSLKMGWLVREGHISMENVAMCDDGEDGNLKPISEYGANFEEKSLEEMAAVTPICNAATIFLAADLIADATQDYRTDYDRKLAQGVIASLELAAEDNDEDSIVYTGTDQQKLDTIRQAIYSISQGNGVLVMSEATWGEIVGLLYRTGNGGALSEMAFNGTTVKAVWSKPVTVVPNELMPTLGDNNYKTYSLDGANVTINHAIFYANPANFRGRQNGGLHFDLSTEAAYELPDGKVQSAYQRNEVVLRGSMFRGAVILDPTRVAAVRALAVIS